jgi:hypothetical protein
MWTGQKKNKKDHQLFFNLKAMKDEKEGLENSNLTNATEKSI